MHGGAWRGDGAARWRALAALPADGKEKTAQAGNSEKPQSTWVFCFLSFHGWENRRHGAA